MKTPSSAQDRFDVLVSSVKDYAIFLLDPTGHVATWNAGARLIKGYDRKRSSASTSRSSTRPKTPPAASHRRCSNRGAKEGRAEDIGWRIRKDGTPVLGRRRHHARSRDRRPGRGLHQGDARPHRSSETLKSRARRQRREPGGDPLQHRRRRACDGRARPHHPHQPRRGAADRAGRTRGGRPPARGGLPHHQRRDARHGAEPRSRACWGRRRRRARQPHGAHLARRDGAAHRRQRRADPRRGGQDARRGPGVSRRDRGEARRGLLRRAHAETVRRSEESLRATLYSIGDGVLATDERARVTRVNPVAERLTGWPESEALGHPIDEVFDIVNEETRAKAINPVGRVLAEGVIVGLANHTALLSRDGVERPIADSGAPILDAEGKPRGAVLVFRDVTAERAAEEALRQSEAKLRSMIDSVRDYAFYMLDPSGRVVSWNPGAEQIKGYRAEEILGQPFSRFFTPRRRKQKESRRSSSGPRVKAASKKRAGGCARTDRASGRTSSSPRSATPQNAWSVS